MWDDIVGEPEGLRSTTCAWNCSYKCFCGTKNCCYILLTTLFAPCLAFCSAINFACLAFQVGTKFQKGQIKAAFATESTHAASDWFPFPSIVRRLL